MVPFLNLFRAEEGNGISPFAVNIDTPGDLVRLVKQFFHPLRRDPICTKNRAITSNQGDNEVDDVDMEAPDRALVSENEENSPSLALPNSTDLNQPDVGQLWD